MKRFLTDILKYVDRYLAKNGGPIILAQIENEYAGRDQAYVDWCGSLVSNEFASTKIPWIMCNGAAANSTIETCNGCNCFDDGWMDKHRRDNPNQPMLFTENWDFLHQWGHGLGVRTPADLGYSAGEWYAAGGDYLSYYMWHGGNQYGRTGGSGMTTNYADDAHLHADGTANEPKYTHFTRFHQILADRAQAILSQNPVQKAVPYWDGKQWTIGTQQFVYSYPSSIHFLISQAGFPLFVLFDNQNISMSAYSVQLLDENSKLLWDSANYSDIDANNTVRVSILNDPLDWKFYSELLQSNLSKIIASKPLEQLNVTKDETVYLWYRRNVTLSQPTSQSIIQVDTRRANSLLFFLDGQFLGHFDDYEHAQGTITITVTVDLSQFRPNEQYLFEILSVSLGIDNYNIGPNSFEYKGIVGNVSLNGQILVGGEGSIWEHQKGLVGEYLQVYTEQGSKQVKWDSQWQPVENRSLVWFQTRFNLDNLARKDLNANPILLDAQGLNRGRAFINGYDLGLYWLIQGDCHSPGPSFCTQDLINCGEPSQRYYHIPGDWLKQEDNLLTIFEELGTQSLQSVGIVQRIVLT